MTPEILVKCPSCRASNELPGRLDVYNSSLPFIFMKTCYFCGQIFTEHDVGERDFWIAKEEGNQKGCQCDYCKSARNFGFTVGHDSDCAVHNGPAYPVGRCDCWLKTVGGNGNDLLICPLCGEKDMDALGFKIHLLNGHCDIWEKIQ